MDFERLLLTIVHEHLLFLLFVILHLSLILELFLFLIIFFRKLDFICPFQGLYLLFHFELIMLYLHYFFLHNLLISHFLIKFQLLPIIHQIKLAKYDEVMLLLFYLALVPLLLFLYLQIMLLKLKLILKKQYVVKLSNHHIN